MNNKTDDIFKNVFIKEFLYNIQVNQRISIGEFFFTKNVFILVMIACFLFWYNQNNINAQKYIAIGTFLIFLYLFKNTRILKKEKYFVQKEDAKNQEMIFHIKLNKLVKNILKRNYINSFFIALIVISTQNNVYGALIDKVDNSTDTQSKNNDLYTEENQKMVERAKIKMMNYLVQEKKIFNINQVTDYIKIESDLRINNARIISEKAKNEIVE